MSVIEYVTEEVRRQGHDVMAPDGLSRVAYMLKAWVYAIEENDSPPIVLDAIHVGQLVEPSKNRAGIRKCGVRVGSRICPPASEVHAMLNSLFLKRDEISPLDFYRQFEEIHPFVDGNGRTGKVLLNWLNGTLLEPIFPPNDFWGHWIQNP